MSRNGSSHSNNRKPSSSSSKRDGKVKKLESRKSEYEEEEAEKMRLAEETAFEKQMEGAVLVAKDQGILPTPVEKARVSLRVYTHKQSVFRAHSFLVGNEQGGLSEKLGAIPIVRNKTTLEELRQLIETTVDNNMIRRNPLYQEFLATVFTLPNPYRYKDKELRLYRFAYYRSPQDLLPTMIPLEAECELLVSESVVNFLTDDLILVARSQLRPDFSLPDPEDHAIAR
jgi:hypothetical protein